MMNRLEGQTITYTRVHDEHIRRCTDDRNILDSLRLGAYRVLAGWVAMSEAKWQEVYTVQTAAIAEMEQRIAELEKALRYIADEGDENWYTPMTDIAIDIARKALGKEIDT